MRLSIIGPVHPYRGGIAHFTASFANAAAAENVVQVVSFSRLYPQFLYPGETDRDSSDHAIRFPAEEIIDTMNPVSWRRSAKLIVQHQPDMVIFQWWTTFLAPCFIGLRKYLRRNKIPVFFQIHNVLPHEPKIFDPWLAKQVLKRADGFIVQTEHEKQRLLAILPDAADRIRICPHPVYDSFMPIQIQKSEAQRLLDLPSDLPILLFFGFIREYKGVKILLDSLAILVDRGVRVFTVLAGEIWEDKEVYLKKVADLNLVDVVRFDNKYIPNEEVPLYFSAADLFVAPYTQGTQSGSASVALHFGVPIVSTDRIAYGLENVGPNLLISVPANNPEAFATGISDMLDRLRSGGAAEPDREEWTSWEDLAASFVDLYETVGRVSNKA
ncbi:MAG: glycosyltransferase [Anaerolineales bacterium]